MDEYIGPLFPLFLLPRVCIPCGDLKGQITQLDEMKFRKEDLYPFSQSPRGDCYKTVKVHPARQLSRLRAIESMKPSYLKSIEITISFEHLYFVRQY